MNKENIYYQQLINNLEIQIKNQQFKTKEDLYNHIMKIKNDINIPQELLNNEKILELLKIYDLHNKTTELDLTNYKGVQLENQNLIVNQKEDIVLKTNSSNESLTKEFKNIQNEIYSQSQNSPIDSEEIFKSMQTTKKNKSILYHYMKYQNMKT